MTKKYKVIFEGYFKTGLPVKEIKQNLLTLYKGNLPAVDLFFAKKRLIIIKDADYQIALKYKTSLEKAGVLCQIIEIQTEILEPPSPEKSSMLASSSDSQIASQTTEPAVAINIRNQPQSKEIPFYDFSLRGILAESWEKIHGVKLELWGVSILIGFLTSLIILAGYGLTLLLGELGKNLYVIYGFQYAFTVFVRPLMAGLIMLGVLHAMNEPIRPSMVFSYYTTRIIILGVIISVIAYGMFALLLFLGVDHFIATASDIFLLPIFALSVPLVIKKQLHSLKAISVFSKIFLRNWIIIITTYLVLLCVNIFGNFFIIGSIWTVPLALVANGILYRSIVREWVTRAETGEGQYEYSGISKISSPQLAGKPILKGNRVQNILAAVMIVFLLVSISVRFWAMYHMRKIHAPDNIAANDNTVCITFNKILFFLTPDGRLQKRVELSILGINGDIADIELMEDGSILIGDQENEVIMQCNITSLKCHRIGPAEGYKINDNFKFLADEKRNLLFIADTNNHRLLVQDLQGGNPKIIESKSTIDYPNDMTLDKEGLLWASNTLHERILSFEVKDNIFVDTGKAINLDPIKSGLQNLKQSLDSGKNAQKLSEYLKDLTKDLVHTRPLALAWGEDRNIWVAATDPYVSRGGVRVFNAEGKQIKSINFKDAIPEDIISVHDKILVADTGLFQVFSILPETYVVSEFGDETFQREIAQVHWRLKLLQMGKTFSGISLLLLAAGAVILIFFILSQKRSVKREASP